MHSHFRLNEVLLRVRWNVFVSHRIWYSKEDNSKIIWVWSIWHGFSKLFPNCFFQFWFQFRIRFFLNLNKQIKIEFCSFCQCHFEKKANVQKIKNHENLLFGLVSLFLRTKPEIGSVLPKQTTMDSKPHSKTNAQNETVSKNRAKLNICLMFVCFWSIFILKKS